MNGANNQNGGKKIGEKKKETQRKRVKEKREKNKRKYNDVLDQYKADSYTNFNSSKNSTQNEEEDFVQRRKAACFDYYYERN